MQTIKSRMTSTSFRITNPWFAADPNIIGERIKMAGIRPDAFFIKMMIRSMKSKMLRDMAI